MIFLGETKLGKKKKKKQSTIASVRPSGDRNPEFAFSGAERVKKKSGTSIFLQAQLLYHIDVARMLVAAPCVVHGRANRKSANIFFRFETRLIPCP